MNLSQIAAFFFATCLACLSMAVEATQPAVSDVARVSADSQIQPGETILTRLQSRPETGASTNISAGFKSVGVDEFARMAADKQNVILDVRTPAEFKAGHLPGAVNLDVNAPDFQEKAALLDTSRTYLVHCASGIRSVKACQKLSRLDFPNLYNLAGGFRAWVKAGKAVEK